MYRCRNALFALLLFASALNGWAQAPDVALPPEVDPDEIINDSYNLLPDREPRMTAAEYAIYEKVVPMVFEQPEFALTLLEAMQDDDEPSSAAFKLVLGNVYFSQDRFDDALELYQAAVEEFPNFRRAWENLGVLHFRNQDYRNAVLCLTKAMELGSKQPRLLGLLAYCQLRTGNTVAAETAYLQAHLAEPENPQWIEALIDLYLESKQLDRAEILAQRRLDLDRDNPDAWTLYASIIRNQQRIPDAIAVLEIAEALGFPSSEGLRLLGDLYVESGDASEASRVYQLAAVRFPTESTERALDYALALLEERSLEPAASILQSLNSLEDDSELEAKRTYGLALLAHYQEDHENAETLLDSLLERNPLYGPALLLRAKLYERAEEPERAAFLYEQALSDEDSAYSANLMLSRLSLEEGDFTNAISQLENALAIQSSPALRDHLAKVKQLARSRDDY